MEVETEEEAEEVVDMVVVVTVVVVEEVLDEGISEVAEVTEDEEEVEVVEVEGKPPYLMSEQQRSDLSPEYFPPQMQVLTSMPDLLIIPSKPLSEHSTHSP